MIAPTPSSSPRVAGDVDADEHDHAAEPEHQAEPADRGGPLGVVEAHRQQCADQGTAAMMIAVSDEATCTSPAAISGNGSEISATA